ncbi:MAG: S9 family peptidase, partial [Pedobacter sp.]
MKNVLEKIYLCFFSLLCMASCKPNVEVEKISIETFFKDAEKSVFSVSPDGKYISYLQPYNGKLNIFVESLDGDSTTRITSEEQQSIDKYFWAGNHHILYVLDNGQEKDFKLFSVTRDGKKNIRIDIKPKTKVKFIQQFEYANHDILLALNERNPENFDVYKLDLRTGKRKMVEKNPGNIINWIADDKDEIRLAIGSDGVTQTVYYRENNNGKFNAVQSCNFKNTLQPIGFTGKKDHIYALSNLKRDKLALVEFNCKTGKETRLLYENKRGDITDVMYSKSLKKMVYVNTEIEKREVHFLDRDIADVYYKIRSRLHGQKFKVVNSDNEETLFVLRSFTDKTPGAYYIYFIKQDSLKKLADVNPAIDPQNMCEQKPVHYKTRDGVTIQGFLTIPKNKAPRNLPCIVIPHEGPHSKNVWGYSEEVQFLANRGYAVFQMNFRGSSGFGKEFKNAGYKKWGTTIHNDITDGVKWLIRNEIADKKKIAIYGFGFGGSAALNQLIYNPDLYACAVSKSGLTNLFTYIKGIPAYYKPSEVMLHEIIGDPEKDVEYLKYSSPIFHAKKIKKPVFIVQGG